ncbi:hypothetical protein LCL85_06390 [Vibrio alginolyticus]|nr:hypothetical protein [Vibrio alginolyticus]
MSKENKSLTIVEISSPNHSNLIESWLSVLGYNDKIDVSLFADAVTANRLSFNGRLEIAPKNKLKLIISLISLIRKNEHVIFNSIQTHFFVFAFVCLFKRGTFTLCVHNSNAWQGVTSGPYVKRVVKKILRSVIIKRMDSLSFCSQSVLDSFSSKTGAKKFVVPFQLSSSRYTKRVKSEKNDKVVVVYPGFISKKRKKYESIISAFKSLGENYELHLLGRPNMSEGGGEIVEACNPFANIITYDSFIPTEDFDRIVDGCDFLISDLGDGKLERYDYVEQYGRTKDSGVSHLIAKHHKPAILNRCFFQLIKNDKLPVLSFECEDDLKSILKEYRASISYTNNIQYSLAEVSERMLPVNIYEKIKHVFV